MNVDAAQKMESFTLQQPNIIAQYNKYMGGVDLADQQRLFCNSTIMGSN